jgi:hypothetical protein
MLLLITAAVVVATAGASARECRFGSNRPAIDTMERHVIPGTPQATCVQETITLHTPSGRTRNVEIWAIRIRK